MERTKPFLSDVLRTPWIPEQNQSPGSVCVAIARDRSRSKETRKGASPFKTKMEMRFTYRLSSRWRVSLAAFGHPAQEDDMHGQEQSSTVSNWLSLGTIFFIAYYRESPIDRALRLLSLR